MTAPENEHQKTSHSSWKILLGKETAELVLKAAAFAFGILYGLGFCIVSIYRNSIGLPGDTEFLRAGYALTGFTSIAACSFLVLPLVFSGACVSNFFQLLNGKHGALRRQLLALAGILLSLAAIQLARLSHFDARPVSVALGSTVIILLVIVWLVRNPSHCRFTGGQTALGYGALWIASLVVCLVAYAEQVHPLIPRSLGGARPLKAQIHFIQDEPPLDCFLVENRNNFVAVYEASESNQRLRLIAISEVSGIDVAPENFSQPFGIKVRQSRREPVSKE